MITCIPIWQHVGTVLALLVSNATMFFITKRKIETLQMALAAKRVLLGGMRLAPSARTLREGETFTLVDDDRTILTVKMSGCTCTVRTFDQ